MKRIKTFESFKSENKVNEEFLGSLFKSLKNKVSLAFSKKFGTASKVDKIMKKYEKELKEARTPKIIAYSKLLNLKDDGDVGKKAKKEYKKIEKLYNKNRDKIKEKFNLKIEQAIEDEKNSKIKNYINIKKLELEQKLIQDEIEELKNQSQLSEKELKEIKYFKNKVKENKERLSEINKRINKEEKIINKKEVKKEDKDIIKVGDVVKYKSSKSDDFFENPVKSLDKEKVEIQTKNSGTIERKISEVEKVKKE